MVHPGGRPTKFQPEYVEQVEKLCRIGAIDEDIAEFFGVCVATIGNWKNEHPEFLEAIKRGKAVEDREVAERLIDRAKGSVVYQDKEVKLKRIYYDADGKRCEDERVEIVRLESRLPPDTPAGIFFLKNRRHDLWRDKQDLKVTGDKEEPVAFTLKIDNG